MTVRGLTRVGETTGTRDADAGEVSHSGVMAAPTNPPLPGSMTVPVWYGWQAILALLLLAAFAAVIFFFLITASGSDSNGRSEWRAFLAARSTATEDGEADPPS